MIETLDTEVVEEIEKQIRIYKDARGYYRQFFY